MNHYRIASDPAPNTPQGAMAAMNANNFPPVCEAAKEQPTLTPDVLDTIRLALMAQVAGCIPCLNWTGSAAGSRIGELWQIDRARRALRL